MEPHKQRVTISIELINGSLSFFLITSRGTIGLVHRELETLIFIDLRLVIYFLLFNLTTLSLSTSDSDKFDFRE